MSRSRTRRAHPRSRSNDHVDHGLGKVLLGRCGPVRAPSGVRAMASASSTAPSVAMDRTGLSALHPACLPRAGAGGARTALAPASAEVISCGWTSLSLDHTTSPSPWANASSSRSRPWRLPNNCIADLQAATDARSSNFERVACGDCRFARSRGSRRPRAGPGSRPLRFPAGR